MFIHGHPHDMATMSPRSLINLRHPHILLDELRIYLIQILRGHVCRMMDTDLEC